MLHMCVVFSITYSLCRGAQDGGGQDDEAAGEGEQDEDGDGAADAGDKTQKGYEAKYHAFINKAPHRNLLDCCQLVNSGALRTPLARPIPPSLHLGPVGRTFGA